MLDGTRHSRFDLQNRLERHFAAARRKQIGIGLWIDGQTSFATLADAPDRGVRNADRLFPAGCLSKLFTAALIDQAVQERELDIDGPLGEQLLASKHGTLFRGQTVRQLLEHTHGCDDALLKRAHLRRDGRIDLERLIPGLEQRVAPPGALYSYSNVGPWLAACLLEQLRGRSYARQLERRLFAPLGMRLCSPDGICASLGGRLVVSLGDMLRFLRGQLDGTFWHEPPRIVPLPGWNPLELGVYRGWKYYGRGWFGHQSVWPGASSLVRLHPELRIAMVVASRDQAAPLVALRLFARQLPGFVPRVAPRVLASRAAMRLDPAAAAACYGSAAQHVAVVARDASMTLSCAGKEHTLQAAERNLFYTRPPALRQFPYVQFLHPGRRGYRHLWNGQRVFRRIGP